MTVMPFKCQQINNTDNKNFLPLSNDVGFLILMTIIANICHSVVRAADVDLTLLYQSIAIGQNKNVHILQYLLLFNSSEAEFL